MGKKTKKCKAEIIFIEDGIGRCRCSKCHESIDPWDKFCKHCGRKVSKKVYLNASINAE